MRLREIIADNQTSGRPRRSLQMLAAVAALCLVPGCGGSGSDQPTTAVTVRLTHGGEPVTEGSVQLVNPESGKGAFGPLDETGTATLSAVPLGTYTVVVMPPAPPDPDPEKPAPPPQEYDNIPAAVRDQTTSPLKAEVKEDTTELTFDLQM